MPFHYARNGQHKGKYFYDAEELATNPNMCSESGRIKSIVPPLVAFVANRAKYVFNMNFNDVP